jgi:uncharacterized membrane protein (UPF0127 family)
LRVVNVTRQKVLAEDAIPARTFWQRLRGLMGRPFLPAGEGLVLFGDNSIHSFFMRFPIDVLYIDGENSVIRLTRGMRPWRVGPLVRGCCVIVELSPGVIEATGTDSGDRILLE